MRYQPADVRRDVAHRGGYDSNRRCPSCARRFPAIIGFAVAMVWWIRVDVDALPGSR